MFLQLNVDKKNFLHSIILNTVTNLTSWLLSHNISWFPPPLPPTPTPPPPEQSSVSSGKSDETAIALQKWDRLFWRALFSWNTSCFWKHSYRQHNYFGPFSVWFKSCFSLRCWSWDAEAVFLILLQRYFSTPFYITSKALITARPCP